MAKSWITFYCSGTYKNNQTKVLRNLGIINVKLNNYVFKRIRKPDTGDP